MFFYYIMFLGHGTMGISNSIGSNTFDILLCLGLPWLIKSLFYPSYPDNHWVSVNNVYFTLMYLHRYIVYNMKLCVFFNIKQTKTKMIIPKKTSPILIL